MTRLELFVGKGGVGKTTVACATALAHRSSGARVLIASLDQAHSLGDALDVVVPHPPGMVAATMAVRPGLDVIEIDSLALLEERFREVLRIFGGAGHDRGIDLAALDPAELTGLPGVQELLMLTEIARFADAGDWDVIVVDCPPSADMLRIVTAPGTLLGYLERVWPAAARMRAVIGPDLRRVVLATTVERIAEAVAGVRDLLTDPERTVARLITLAERVAVAESARVRSAAALLGLRLDEVVVNKVLPELPDDPALPEHPAARWYAERRAEQLAVVGELRRRMPDLPVRIASHTGPEPVGPAALSALPVSSGAAAGVPDPMLGDEVSGDRARVGTPTVGLESGQGLGSVFAMRMRLPVADPATLRLGRVEDDLIVGADGVRRRLRLAPVLRRCTVEGAELDGDQLVVRFRPDPEAWPE